VIRDQEQEAIDNAAPLTDEEQAEKAHLAEQGFSNWSRKDFGTFVTLSAKYGRKNFAMIAQEMETKDEKDVRKYAKVFWERYKEMPNWEKFINTIETGEEKSAKISQQKKMLRKKIEMYRVPLQQLKLSYSVSTTNKKVYTEEEDRFLLVQLDKFGLDAENLHEKIRDEIRESPTFRFDWFFLSRTSLEISRRCTTLISTVARELEENGTSVATVKATAAKKSRDREEEEEEEGPPAKKGKANSGTAKETNGKITKQPPKVHIYTLPIQIGVAIIGIKLKEEQNKQVEQTKKGGDSKATSNATSRASSVDSKASAATSVSKSKSRSKKR